MLVLLPLICSCSSSVNYNHEKDVNSEQITYELKKEIKDDFKDFYMKKDININTTKTYIYKIYGIYNNYKSIGIWLINETLEENKAFNDAIYYKFLDFWILSSSKGYIGIYYDHYFYNIEEAYELNFIDYDEVSDIASQMNGPDWDI